MPASLPAQRSRGCCSQRASCLPGGFARAATAASPAPPPVPCCALPSACAVLCLMPVLRGWGELAVKVRKEVGKPARRGGSKSAVKAQGVCRASLVHSHSSAEQGGAGLLLGRTRKPGPGFLMHTGGLGAAGQLVLGQVSLQLLQGWHWGNPPPQPSSISGQGLCPPLPGQEQSFLLHPGLWVSPGARKKPRPCDFCQEHPNRLKRARELPSPTAVALGRRVALPIGLLPSLMEKSPVELRSVPAGLLSIKGAWHRIHPWALQFRVGQRDIPSVQEMQAACWGRQGPVALAACWVRKALPLLLQLQGPDPAGMQRRLLCRRHLLPRCDS